MIETTEQFGQMSVEGAAALVLAQIAVAVVELDRLVAEEEVDSVEGSR